MIQIKEAQVSGFRPLKYGVNITLNIKDEDISKKDKENLEEFWKSGNSIIAVLQEFQTENKVNNRGYLHILMEKYCEKENISIEKEKERLYKKYNIVSRTELTDQQVDYEIESYKAGLDFF